MDFESSGKLGMSGFKRGLEAFRLDLCDSEVARIAVRFGISGDGNIHYSGLVELAQVVTLLLSSS